MASSVDFSCEVHCVDTDLFSPVESADALKVALDAFGCYEERNGQEFLRLKGKNISVEGESTIFPIYRARDPASLAHYIFLRTFSPEWKEIILEIGDTSEKVLIQKEDEGNICDCLKTTLGLNR